MTMQDAATPPVISRDATQLVTILEYPDDGQPGQRERDIGQAVANATFEQLVQAIELTSAKRGRGGVIGLYRAWIAAHGGGAPQLFAAWFNLGVELGKVGDTANAVTAYRNALALRPDFHLAAVNLGLVLEAGGNTDAALQVWRGALQSDDARTTLLNHRGRLLEKTKHLAEAEQELRVSLLINPRQPDVIQHWTHLRQKMCQWPVLCDDIPGLSKDDALTHAGPLGVLALTDDVATQCRINGGWISRKTSAVRERLSPPGGYAHERIRIGYISSDFCRHAMSYLIAELFERHDRSAFEVYGYCSSPEDGSDIRRRVIAAFDHFRLITPMSDEQAARVIADDRIDILIDLNGLTAGARLQILRWRPAPVQATYLGFVGPVPLPELDYLLCDDYVVPPRVAPAYLPKPLCIGETYQANDSKRTIGRPMSRAEVGLPADRFVLCCFSNHYKVTEAIFAAWMAILRQADNAVLWLAADTEWSARNLTAAAICHGINPARLLFMPRADPSEYMARLGLADLFLDTFPYNAGTIASDAIRMRVPLLTVEGQAFASRMAGRLLSAIGARQGIAPDPAEYTKRAVHLASNTEAYAAYRALFTEAAWARSIGDIAAFTSGFEACMKRIVRRPLDGDAS